MLLSSIIFAQVKAPKIYAPEKMHRFGDIKEGEVLKFNFVVQNKGDANLQIVKVRASCGCTAVVPAKNVLLPSDSTNIMVSFNSAHKSGLQRKYVYIYSNDKENPQIRLAFTVNVISSEVSKRLAKGPKLYFPSTQYNFGAVQAGTIVTGKLKFTNSGKDVLRIDRLEPSAEYITAVTNKSVVSPGASGKLSIRFNTSNRTGKITRTIAVYSNDPRNPREIITIYINIVPKEK